MTDIPEVEPLVCIGCVARVDPLSDEAEGWVLVEHSVDEGDDHDDAQWKCGECATPADRLNAQHICAEAIREALEDEDEGV